MELCRNADVILAVGTRFADETTCSYRKGVSFNFPETKLIHIDIDPGEIGKPIEPISVSRAICAALWSK